MDFYYFLYKIREVLQIVDDEIKYYKQIYITDKYIYISTKIGVAAVPVLSFLLTMKNT